MEPSCSSNMGMSLLSLGIFSQVAANRLPEFVR